ncbi:MAG TPA: PTS sugar transporter subunit IIB [bacterium]|nr:PTS sugar transporter subunit IIB [bacterium]HQG45328.1 PTS sugar transporter subunit IIB [bacterium]HQI49607.1 PTS sugar transporter subunit IIB [bacterium]HQJ64047.1 PTS sugar transporter subunit IIB [bacterium]
MPLVQVRIDDRLIHGQVVVGWRHVLDPQRIMLCSDEVATSDWQKTIYMSAVTNDIAASVLTLQETVAELGSGLLEKERVLLLVDSPKMLVQLVDAGVPITEVNVGGMHFRAGKNQIAPFIFVDEEDISHFRTLYERGIKLEGRDVPTRSPIDIAHALRFEPL